jgi:hypothetical protein
MHAQMMCMLCMHIRGRFLCRDIVPRLIAMHASTHSRARAHTAIAPVVQDADLEMRKIKHQLCMLRLHRILTSTGV